MNECLLFYVYFVVKYIKIIQERKIEEYRFRIHAKNSDCRKIR